jgi:hypothetical protein
MFYNDSQLFIATRSSYLNREEDESVEPYEGDTMKDKIEFLKSIGYK